MSIFLGISGDFRLTAKVLNHSLKAQMSGRRTRKVGVEPRLLARAPQLCKTLLPSGSRVASSRRAIFPQRIPLGSGGGDGQSVRDSSSTPSIFTNIANF